GVVSPTASSQPARGVVVIRKSQPPPVDSIQQALGSASSLSSTGSAAASREPKLRQAAGSEVRIVHPGVASGSTAAVDIASRFSKSCSEITTAECGRTAGEESTPQETMRV